MRVPARPVRNADVHVGIFGWADMDVGIQASKRAGLPGHHHYKAGMN